MKRNKIEWPDRTSTNSDSSRMSLKRKLLEFCMAFDESVAAEALRLFDFLLERPCQPILESLILNNLQDRSYFLNYSPESMSSWSDEEDEREKIRRVSVSPTPAGSASVSSTPAPHSSAVTRSSPAAGLASGSNLAGSRTLAPGMVSNAQLFCNHLAILIVSKDIELPYG